MSFVRCISLEGPVITFNFAESLKVVDVTYDSTKVARETFEHIQNFLESEAKKAPAPLG